MRDRGGERERGRESEKRTLNFDGDPGLFYQNAFSPL